MDLFQWLKNAYMGEQSAVRILDASHTPLVRRRYRFSGFVQGVGFRYEAKMLASQLDLAGWTRNGSDGTVTVEIEGSAACVDEFLRVMQTVPRFEITDIHAEDLPLAGNEATFKVLY